LGSLQRSPRLPAGFQGPISKGKEGRGEDVREERGGEGREENGKEGMKGRV